MSNTDDLYEIASEPIAVLRQRYLVICDNHYCAAMLLDLFYAQATAAWEREGFSQHYPTAGGNDPTCIYATEVMLAMMLFGLFDLATIHEAMVLLLQKGYIKVWYDGEIPLGQPEEERALKIWSDREAVRRDSLTGYQAVCEQEEKKSSSGSPGERMSKRPSFDSQAAVTAQEQQRVESQCKRAARTNLSATLTLDEWFAILNDFAWCCAYCQGPYELLEHFVPLSHGGGTTRTNCVPACRRCNSLKESWNPLSSWGPDMAAIREGIERVKQYLAAHGMEETS